MIEIFMFKYFVFISVEEAAGVERRGPRVALLPLPGQPRLHHAGGDRAEPGVRGVHGGGALPLIQPG